MKVVVLGAGLPALSTAQALAERGLAVTVIEPPGFVDTYADDCPMVFGTPDVDSTHICGGLLLNRDAGLGFRQRAAWLSRRWLGQRHALSSLRKQRGAQLVRQSQDELQVLSQQLGFGTDRLRHGGTMEMFRCGATGVSSLPILDGLSQFRIALRGHLLARGVTFLRRALVGAERREGQLRALSVRSEGGLPEALPLQSLVIADWDFARPLAAEHGMAPPLARVLRLCVRFTLPYTSHQRTWSIRDEVLGMHALRSQDAAWVFGPRSFGQLERDDPESTEPLLAFARTTLGIERRAMAHRPSVQHSWATPDGLPLVGPLPSIHNLYLNLGHGSASAPTLFGTAFGLAAQIQQDLQPPRQSRL